MGVGVFSFPRNMFRFHVSFRGCVQNIYTYMSDAFYSNMFPLFGEVSNFSKNLIRNPNWITYRTVVTFQDAHGFQMFL